MPKDIYFLLLFSQKIKELDIGDESQAVFGGYHFRYNS